MSVAIIMAMSVAIIMDEYIAAEYYNRTFL